MATKQKNQEPSSNLVESRISDKMKVSSNIHKDTLKGEFTSVASIAYLDFSSVCGMNPEDILNDFTMPNEDTSIGDYIPMGFKEPLIGNHTEILLESPYFFVTNSNSEGYVTIGLVNRDTDPLEFHIYALNNKTEVVEIESLLNEIIFFSVVTARLLISQAKKASVVLDQNFESPKS